jgi:hypothetical protein
MPSSPSPSPCSFWRSGHLAWLATGALLGAVLPVLGVVVIAAFNAYYWLPIRGESPRLRP